MLMGKRCVRRVGGGEVAAGLYETAEGVEPGGGEGRVVRAERTLAAALRRAMPLNRQQQGSARSTVAAHAAHRATAPFPASLDFIVPHVFISVEFYSFASGLRQNLYRRNGQCVPVRAFYP